VVIDANVLIKQIRLMEVMGVSDSQEFDAAYEVHTIKEVIKEIKDDNARTFMQNLPYELVIHEYVEDEFMTRVRAFAKETGDYKTLSETDMRVMALGLQLNEERGEGDRVQRAPKPLAEFRPKRFQEDYKRIEEGEEDHSDEETDSDEGSQEEEPSGRRGKNPKEGEGFDDGFQQVT
jgi:rRNA maturation endonuclease Nob1